MLSRAVITFLCLRRFCLYLSGDVAVLRLSATSLSSLCSLSALVLFLVLFLFLSDNRSWGHYRGLPMSKPIAPSGGDNPNVATPSSSGIAIPSSAEACASTGQPEASPPSTGSKPTPTTSSQLKLRSVPATTVAKKEPLLEAAPTIPASAVIDLDADWTDTSPLDHSSCMKGVLMSVGSPPNELETNDPVSSKIVGLLPF